MLELYVVFERSIRSRSSRMSHLSLVNFKRKVITKLALHVRTQIRSSNGKRLLESPAVGEERERCTDLDESHGNDEAVSRSSRFYVLSEKSRCYDGDTEGDERRGSEENSL